MKLNQSSPVLGHSSSRAGIHHKMSKVTSIEAQHMKQYELSYGRLHPIQTNSNVEVKNSTSCANLCTKDTQISKVDDSYPDISRKPTWEDMS